MYVLPYVLAYLVMNMIRGRDYASSYDILEELLDVVFFAPVPPRATRPSTVAPAWRETGRKERLSFGSMACSGRERERERVCVCEWVCSVVCILSPFSVRPSIHPSLRVRLHTQHSYHRDSQLGLFHFSLRPAYPEILRRFLGGPFWGIFRLSIMS